MGKNQPAHPLVLGLLNGCSGRPLLKMVANPLELTGRYVATEQVDLRPQVSGRIVEVLVESCQRRSGTGLNAFRN